MKKSMYLMLSSISNQINDMTWIGDLPKSYTVLPIFYWTLYQTDFTLSNIFSLFQIDLLIEY